MIEKELCVNTIFGAGLIIYSNSSSLVKDSSLIDYAKSKYVQKFFFIVLVSDEFIKVVQNPFDKPVSWFTPRFCNFFALNPLLVKDKSFSNQVFLDIAFFNVYDADFFMNINQVRSLNKSYSLEKDDSFIDRFSKGLGVLEYFLKSDLVEDVVFEKSFQPVHLSVKNLGELFCNIFVLSDEIERISTKARLMSGRGFDKASPVLSIGFKEQGVRLTGISEPFSFEKTSLVFRKHNKVPFSLLDLLRLEMIDTFQAAFLSQLISNKAKILITGHRSSGKTTLLNSLLFEINNNTRLIVIEDSNELSVDLLKDNFYKLFHIKFSEKQQGSRTNDIIRHVLRLGQGAMIVGEVRGYETKTLFEAMRVGASDDVVLGTIHGSDGFDTYQRIVNDLGVSESSFKSVNFIVSLSNVGSENKRKLIDISEVNRFGSSEKNDLINNIIFYDFEKKSWVVKDLKSSETINRFSKRFNNGLSHWFEELRLRETFFELCVNNVVSFQKYILLRRKLDALVREFKAKSDYSKAENVLKGWFLND